MFGSIGMPELILIFIVALLVFGPRKLPEIGRSIGKGLAEFKRASDDLKKTIEHEIEQGKSEVAAVKDHVAGVEKSLRETASAPGFGAGGGTPAPAEPPAQTAASAAPAASPAADSRPIEPS
jgi:sec-independent protein translocase protein TatA